MSFKSFLSSLNIRQNSKTELLCLNVDVSLVDGSNAGVIEGSNYVTVAKTGIGDYLITLNRTAQRAIQFVGGGVIGEGLINIKTAPSTSVISVILDDDAGTPTDFDFHLTLAVFYSPHER